MWKTAMEAGSNTSTSAARAQKVPTPESLRVVDPDVSQNQRQDSPGLTLRAERLDTHSVLSYRVRVRDEIRIFCAALVVAFVGVCLFVPISSADTADLPAPAAIA